MHTTARLILPHSCGCLTGHADGRIQRVTPEEGGVLQRYQFTGAAVQWLLATPDGSRLVAGHADGLVVVFERLSGEEISECSVLLQSEYCPTEAQTTGELSADGRWLFVTIARGEMDIGWLIDLTQQARPHRRVGPSGSKPGRPAQWP